MPHVNETATFEEYCEKFDARLFHMLNFAGNLSEKPMETKSMKLYAAKAHLKHSADFNEVDLNQNRPDFSKYSFFILKFIFLFRTENYPDDNIVCKFV